MSTQQPLQSASSTSLAKVPPVDDSPQPDKVHLKVLVISGQNRFYSFEPDCTVGRVKELVWSSWPKEWTDPAQPPSPSYLRILHSGRILQDDTSLSSNKLPAGPSSSPPTVVHISVRSFSIKGDDEPKKPSAHRSLSRQSVRAADDEVGGCKCIIM
ncbi:hypothetical protein, variant [Cryptococcus amylolentus CBS 6039]|uniref:Ubiquitin-like domain-containing protein n=2 Tax=Cryptococcus amylolentus TaxID=104669 RepID=A0A1E3HSR6_9TREE|nr:hypothetical protein L202_03392 [Cryptococcus amylolentus CBS 6039]XP_018994246.1 hypothetical protein, variant [Cryptococcus amylolentus CBS 6039]ODN79398.1 hypothetical protein L202_03392 [Cryptococcus amylolentus CBS 6039]ODN79399.1 hypothetical protein, variant [Cryptococcus amylolentus CBS 6039]ODO07775.1 hypothetical protein I350_03353 [Cryptococcus amylolentus CBS 6273]